MYGKGAIFIQWKFQVVYAMNPDRMTGKQPKPAFLITICHKEAHIKIKCKLDIKKNCLRFLNSRIWKKIELKL